MGQMGRALSWKDGSSHQMMMVPLCCAIWYAHRWDDTCILTTVVVTRAIIRRHSTLTREWSRTLTSQKIGSHMVFTGVEWVCLSNERDLILILLIPRLGFKGDGDENSVFPAFNQCIFADPYPREDQANFAKWYVTLQ